MNFREIIIGMPIFLILSPDTFGVITKYIGKEHESYWVEVDFGDHHEEFPLEDLGKFQ